MRRNRRKAKITATSALCQNHALGGSETAGEWFRRWFLVSAGVILAVTGIAKFQSAGGDAGILSRPDPIFGIPFGRLLFVVGVAEVLVASLCFFGRWPHFCTLAVTWLATGFLIYRIGTWLTGWQHSSSCGCLGQLTETLGLSSHVADRIVVVLLAYLLIGGYSIILISMKRSRAQRSGASKLAAQK